MTNPLTPSAPMSPANELHVPSAPEVRGELVRAEAELMYAIRRHRRAWTAMADFKQEHRLAGREYSENDPRWKKRTSDVSWWCAEMAAQAGVVTALIQMDERRTRSAEFARVRPDPLDPTAARARGVTRDIVLSWNEALPPVETEYRHARAWWKITGGNPAGDDGKTARLIETYERMHPGAGQTPDAYPGTQSRLV